MDREIDTDRESVLKDLIVKIRATSCQRGQLIPLLQMIQAELGYLPLEAMKMVADHLGISPAEVFGVATFYNQFRFNPPGKHPIQVCLGTACHVKGGEIILENFERKLGIKQGQTSEDGQFSLERVDCVGCCALAPVAVMDQTLHGHMAPSKVEGLILQIQIDTQRRQREGPEK